MGLLDMLSGAPAWLGHEAMQGGRWLGHEVGGLFGPLGTPASAPGASLGGGQDLSGTPQTPAAPMPAPVPQAGPRYVHTPYGDIDPQTGLAKPSAWRMVSDVLGGMKPNDAYDYERARPMQQAMRTRQMMTVGRLLEAATDGIDPNSPGSAATQLQIPASMGGSQSIGQGPQTTPGTVPTLAQAGRKMVPGPSPYTRQRMAAAALSLANGDYKGYAEALKGAVKVGPNGVAYDENDPGLAGQSFEAPVQAASGEWEYPSQQVGRPQVNKDGQIVSRDAQGNPSVSLAPGYAQAQAALKRSEGFAVADSTPPVTGAVAAFDSSGRMLGWHMPDGSLKSIGEVEKAKAMGPAQLETVTVDTPAGPRLMTKAQAAAYAGGQGGGPGASSAGTALPADTTPAEAAYLGRTAQLESSGDSGAQNGSSTGLFQFHPSTFKALGGTDITDPAQQAAVALQFRRVNAPVLAKALGRSPSDAELYLAHQQGPGGARALLTAPPETNAVAALEGAGVRPEVAQASIVGNGGSPDMTAGQFVGMWRQRYGGSAQAAAGSDLPGVAVATPQRLSPQAVQKAGLPPGVYDLMPNGDTKLVQAAPKDDVARVSDMLKAASSLDDLATIEGNFLQHNRNVNSGVGYVQPHLWGMDLNPVASLAAKTNPDFKAMQGLQNQELFKVKPEGVGRILQSELPLWRASTQSVDQTPAVNAAIAQEHAQQRDQLHQKAAFYQDWLYNRGTLQGADQAWSQTQRGPRAPTAPAKAAQPPSGVPATARQAPDGHWYSPDPNRPGKYVRWQ